MMNNYEKERSIEIRTQFLEETGRFIVKKRKYIGLTQAELGEYLEVNPTTVSRYENGEIDMPSSNLAMISSVCGFPMREYATAWDRLELKDVFKKSLELIKYGKKEVRYDFVTSIGSLTHKTSESREIPNDMEINFMVQSCSEETAQDLISISATLESIEDDNLQRTLTTTMIEYYLKNNTDRRFRERMITYYEAFTGRKLR